MSSDALLLVGQETTHDRSVYETHADRLARRDVVDAVHVATYDDEPGEELREELGEIEADRVYAVPLAVAHTHDTIDAIPAALSYVSGDVRYCEPLGGSPAVTELLLRRATDLLPAADDASLVIVGFGSSAKPFPRQVAAYHAARIREQSDYADVVTCFLLQNPAVECARYAVSTPRAVAVPLFLTRCEATDVEIPAKLEVDRGGLEYADPLGDDPGVTDAIHAEVEKQRVYSGERGASSPSFEASLTETRRPVLADGEGADGSRSGGDR